MLKGRFEVRWNDDGSGSATLGLYDTVSFPPGVCRSFRNVGDAEGILQVIITGGVHDMNDIDFAADAKAKIEAVGKGLSMPLNTFDASIPSGQSGRRLILPDAPDVDSWWLADLNAPSGYAGAVAVEESIERLMYSVWEPNSMSQF